MNTSISLFFNYIHCYRVVLFLKCYGVQIKRKTELNFSMHGNGARANVVWET